MLDKGPKRLNTIVFYLRRQSTTYTVQTTRDLLLVLHSLAQCPLGIETDEVDTGVSAQDDVQRSGEAVEEQTLDEQIGGSGTGDELADVQTIDRNVDEQAIVQTSGCNVDEQPVDKDISDEATRWKDVGMPIPLKVVSPGKMPQPPPRSLAKVLVLDMNGLLLRRYPYPEDPPFNTGFQWDKVYKGGRDIGTVCLTRPDAYDFVRECGSMFYLCLWSSCTVKNINVVMNKVFRGLHPHIWKAVLSQTECTKMPFRLTDIKQLKDSKEKPVFTKDIDTLISMKPEFQGLGVLIVDDTRYKNMLNPECAMICPPTFEPSDQAQDPNYLTHTLLPWLKGWKMAVDSDAYVKRNMISNDRDQQSQHVINHWLRLCK